MGRWLSHRHLSKGALWCIHKFYEFASDLMYSLRQKIQGALICFTTIFYPFGFRGSASNLCWMLISWSSFFSMVLTEKVMKGEIGEIAMVVWSWWQCRIGLVLCNLKQRYLCGGVHNRRSESYLSGWKSKVWP
jgi:hypothetical protein